jgi:hypothetical protein
VASLLVERHETAVMGERVELVARPGECQDPVLCPGEFDPTIVDDVEEQRLGAVA